MNGNAGRFRLSPQPEAVQELIDHLGLSLQVVPTHSEAEMVEALRRAVADRQHRIVVAGGDGTIHTAAQILAHTETALGIVPQGTMNNVANALRLPLDLPSALRVACHGEVRPVDLGRACERYFVESAGVGLFADALAVYGSSSNKNLWRGLIALVRVLADFRARRLRIEINGKVGQERAVFAVAANSFRIAQGLPVAPEASLTDGELDLLVLGDLERREIIPYLRAIRQQLHLTLPKAHLYRGRSIEIAANRTMPVHVDDRERGRTPVRIRAEPGALRVVVERL
jgi:diacylglycerol kinase (ATP)